MAARFALSPTDLKGLIVLERQPIDDARGSFERVFCGHDLRQAGVDWLPVQVNRTMTRKKGAARGLHYQLPPHAEVKIVHCLRGHVFDVAVDLRNDSPTFLQWHGEELSGGNSRAMLIPKGFAHGFQTLTDNCEMLYFHSEYYQPEAEAGIHLCDEELGIDWPLPIIETSNRDANLGRIPENFEGLKL